MDVHSKREQVLKYRDAIQNSNPNPSPEFDSPLSNKGRNGKVFFVSTPGVDCRIVCKMSRSLDYTVRHEYSVMEKLMELESPHFPVPYGVFPVTVDCNYRRKVNPFEITSGMYPIDVDVLLMEYIENGVELEKFCKTRQNTPVLHSLVKQVMLAICEAQEKLQFTHYDLHPANVIVHPSTTERLKYSVGGKTHTVLTHGYIATIIDFGLSHVSGLQYQYAPLFHTDCGVFTDRYKPFVDLKLFLVGLNRDIESVKLDKFVHKMYGKLNIDWKYGWDICDGYCNAVNYILSQVFSIQTTRTRLFSEYGYMCLALIQTLLPHPMKANRGFKDAYHVIELEFEKIEKEIGSVFYNMYILYRAVDIARNLYELYMADETRVNAVYLFKRETLHVVGSVAKFCKLDTVNWEKLLCGMYAFAGYMGSKMSAYIEMQIENTKYKMPVKSDMGVYTKYFEEFLR
jgi:hypothetical protein